MSAGETKTLTQFIAAGAANLGALAFGLVLGWSSPVELKIHEFNFEFTADDFSWAGSVVPLGAAIACIPTGYMLDILGPKLTMLIISLPFLLGWIFIIWPAAVEMLIVGRFITGFCGAIFCVAAPSYISDIAEAKIRGLLGSFYQLFVVIGIELAYIIGAYVNVFWFTFICGLFPIIFAVCFFFVPDSPQHLLKKNKLDAAEKSLQWLRGPHYNPANELKEMKATVDETAQLQVSFIEMFQDRKARKGIFIVVGLMAMQQLSGINAVIFYTNAIFAATGSTISPKISTIIVGGVQVLSTFPALALVDKAGRKVCLLISTCGMFVFISILGFYFFFQEELMDQGWLPLTTLILYIILFAIGAGPVVWIIGSEIFAPGVKGRASGIGAMSNWILAFFVTKFYGDISESLGIYTTYWFFGVCCVLGALHVIFFVPETKGKTIDEILKDL